MYPHLHSSLYAGHPSPLSTGEKLRSHIHWVFIVAIWVVALIMIALVLVRAAHFILPEKWHWLNEAQNHDIERILFSGVIVSVLGKYFTKYKLLE